MFQKLLTVRKTWLFRGLAVGLSCCLLLFFEIGLRLSHPEIIDSIVQFRLNAEKTDARRFSAIKQADPELLWKLKPQSLISETEHLNSFGFRGDEFAVSKKSETRRIVVLGDSRSFGFGLMNRNEIFAQRMQNYFASASEQPQFEVINLSVIGYTSFQGKQLFDSFAKRLNPDYVVIWFGFNDLLYYHITDHAAADSGALTVIPQKILSKFYLYHWLTDLWNRLAVGSTRGTYFTQSITERVPPYQYEQNLRQMIKSAVSAGARPVLLSSPVRPDIPLVLNSRIRSNKTTDGEVETHLVTQYEIDGFWLMDQQEFPGSEEELDTLIARHGDLAILRYFKGIKLRNRQEHALAEAEFAEASRLDVTRQTVNHYNDITRRIASESGGTFIDLVTLFDDYGQFSLFIDDCHPNSNGHGLIAAAILEKLTGKASRVFESGSESKVDSGAGMETEP